MACFKNNPYEQPILPIPNLNVYLIHSQLCVKFNDHISVTEHYKCEVSMSTQEIQDEKSYGNLNSIPLVYKHDTFFHSVIPL